MAGKTVKFSGKGLAGDLLDTHNWTGGIVPGLADTAQISMNVGGPITGTFSVNNVMLLGTEQITLTGTLDTAGVGNCTGLMVCDGAVATFAPGAVLNDRNVLIVGNDAVGTVIAQGSGMVHSVLNTVSGNIGKLDEGVGTVTIGDAIWNNSGQLLIGDEGVGTLNIIDAGSVLVGGNAAMAVVAGSSGAMTIASDGFVSVTGALGVGGKGVASVSVGGGGSLVVDKTLSVGAGSVLSLDGGTVSGGVLTGTVQTLAGGVISGFGSLANPDATWIQDAGTIKASGGTLAVAGKINGTGSIQIAANSTAVLSGASLSLASIAFIGADATLSLAHGSNVTAAISGFAIGDVITMANVDAVSFKPSTGVLTLNDAGKKVDSLHLTGSFSGDVFALHQSAGVGTIVLQHS